MKFFESTSNTVNETIAEMQKNNLTIATTKDGFVVMKTGTDIASEAEKIPGNTISKVEGEDGAEYVILARKA
jgi:hypothetical protein